MLEHLRCRRNMSVDNHVRNMRARADENTYGIGWMRKIVCRHDPEVDEMFHAARQGANKGDGVG